MRRSRLEQTLSYKSSYSSFKYKLRELLRMMKMTRTCQQFYIVTLWNVFLSYDQNINVYVLNMKNQEPWSFYLSIWSEICHHHALQISKFKVKKTLRLWFVILLLFSFASSANIQAYFQINALANTSFKETMSTLSACIIAIWFNPPKFYKSCRVSLSQNLKSHTKSKKS